MRSVLDYVIRILKEGKGDREMIDSLKSLKSTVGNIVGVAGGFAAAWATVDRVVDASEQTFTGLTDSVRDFHRLTGMSTESSSRLIETFADLGISQEKVTTAFRYAEDKGFKPTIESVLALQKEYLSLGAGTERLQFLTEQFGAKGAVEMQKFFETTDAAARLQNVSVGKIVSERDIALLQEYRDQLDELKDAQEEFQMETARISIPIKMAAIDFGKAFLTSYQSFMMVMKGDARAAAEFLKDERVRETLKEMKSGPDDSATRSYTAMAEAYTKQAEAQAQAAEVSAEAHEAALKDFKGLLDFSGKYMDFQDQISIKEAEIAKARQQGYSDTGRKMSGLKEELAALEAQEKAFMDQFLLQMLMMSGVPVDTLMVLAENMGLIDQKTVDAYTSAKILADNIGKIPANQKKTFEYYVKLTGDVNRALFLLANSNIPVGYQINYLNNGQLAPSEQATGGPLSPVTKVGEQGYEYIINGMVIPHEASLWLERAGVMGAGRALGGPMPMVDQVIYPGAGGYTKPTSTGVKTVSTKGKDYSYVTTGTVFNPVTVATETATAALETIAPVAISMTQATAAVVEQNHQTQLAIQANLDAQIQASGEIVDAVNNQAKNIADIVVDAVRQVIQYNG